MSIDNLQYISEERIFMNELVLISIEIPDNLVINGKNIEKKDINEFIVPSSITKLGDWCFDGCSSLTSITIPTRIIKIGGGCCFYVCPSLTSINIPSSISKIGDCCFSKYKSLTSITMPAPISKIGTSCFEGCSSITSITITSSITSFGYRCFYGCGCEEELKKNKTIPRNCFDAWQQMK
ncbi:hypothetical protein, conserved [Entamoeba dispar SAW760]|uniref:Leucine rich repeat containing protein BspA family protein n=1 Tax=Entamoeba dispar (strain ATCC PRA-260 / SAW760) TaxID=370354 RepID=B0EBL8_ENTDS|nr:uncharacterized protein EDI_324970 [Entamoeba dispar SAW760]EDR28030.1 hypothetical protein, conserved [Entamoeba dispar SAW760]|eukprot:EDR28030.1 hypothetical protein, conserved [Entamoeba dispar SAW760]